VLGQEDKGRL
jgi:hypothetical protein